MINTIAFIRPALEDLTDSIQGAADQANAEVHQAQTQIINGIDFVTEQVRGFR
jgi:hypothetical protein